MQLSAEIRWFWRSKAPAGLKEWFTPQGLSHPCAAGGGATPRTDLYCRDTKQNELGIKARGNAPGCEVKGLVALLGSLNEAPFTGTGELWTKWSTEGLRFETAELIATTKLRWLRKLDTSGAQVREVELGPDEKPKQADDVPRTGCQVELTRIVVADQTWWSLGFESFGTMATVERDLRAGVSVMARRNPPALIGGTLASYPTWLKERAAES